MADRRSTLRQIGRSLRHRNYRLFFTGQLISLIGTWMQSVAESWLVYRLTGSATLLGWVGFAAQIPVFLLAPIGGLVADRFNRHRILLVTQASMMFLAAVLAAFTLSGRVRVWQVMTLAASLGAVNAFDIPARQSFVAVIVGRGDLPNAIALNSSMFNGARIAGPAVAGVLVAAIGEGWCFLANAVSYVAVIACLLLMKSSDEWIPAPPAPVLEHIAEGFRYVAGAAPVRALLLQLGVISLVAMPYAVLMPIFADRILHGGPSALGLLMGASGAGAFFAALILAARSGVRGLGRWVAMGSAGLGISLILFSQSRVLWVSMLLMFPAGACMMVQMASSNTLIQAMVPDRLRGRVMAVYSMMFMGMAPFGALLAGSFAERLGAPAVLAAGGIIAVGMGGLFAFRLPSLRPEARRLLVAQQMVGGDPAQEVTGVPESDAPDSR
jgi:MFS family permease